MKNYHIALLSKTMNFKNLNTSFGHTIIKTSLYDILIIHDTNGAKKILKFTLGLYLAQGIGYDMNFN